MSISDGYQCQPCEMTFNGQGELNSHNQQEYKQKKWKVIRSIFIFF